MSSHRAISTKSEPWFLLPLLYSMRQGGAYTDYNHTVMAHALEQFVAGLPGGRESYRAALRDAALRIYELASTENATYFLDKTPRYHLIVDELCDLFPNAKLIFLWRHPLAVVASMTHSWASGRWRLHGSKVDLYRGLEKLLRAYEAHRERSLAIRYEDLVLRTEETTSRIEQYLELPRGEMRLDRATPLTGTMGDPTARMAHDFDPASLDRWTKSVRTPLRKRWCARYLEWIGRDRVLAMGYDYAAIRAELDSIPPSWRGSGRDLVDLFLTQALSVVEVEQLRRKLKTLPRLGSVHVHQ